MKRTILFLSAVVLWLTQPARAANAVSDANQFWPQWRGPLATGVAPLADPPLTWNETNHVKWKVKIPGSGDSTPIVWGDRVFILTAIPTGKKAAAKSSEIPAGGSGSPAPAEGQPRRGGMGSGPPNEVYQFMVLCLDRKTGKTLWQKVAREKVPHEGHQQNNTFASASPITDGEHVLAYFGSRGLHCYDVEGNLNDKTDASLALVGKELFVRGRQSLYCIGEGP
jgi:outer membrane protein assembly factor BamB